MTQRKLELTPDQTKVLIEILNEEIDIMGCVSVLEEDIELTPVQLKRLTCCKSIMRKLKA